MSEHRRTRSAPPTTHAHDRCVRSWMHSRAVRCSVFRGSGGRSGRTFCVRPRRVPHRHVRQVRSCCREVLDRNLARERALGPRRGTTDAEPRELHNARRLLSSATELHTAPRMAAPMCRSGALAEPIHASIGARVPCPHPAPTGSRGSSRARHGSAETALGSTTNRLPPREPLSGHASRIWYAPAATVGTMRGHRRNVVGCRGTTSTGGRSAPAHPSRSTSPRTPVHPGQPGGAQGSRLS